MAVQRFELDPDRSRVWIEGSSSLHPIKASADGLVGWVVLDLVPSGLAAGSEVTGEVRIAVDRLNSGNPLVDAETRRRVDARRHPEIVGVLTGSSIVADDRLALRGDLTFRGETHPVEGDVVVERAADGVRLTGEQRFDVRTWGLQPPRIGLLRVHPDVTVRLDAWAIDRSLEEA